MLGGSGHQAKQGVTYLLDDISSLLLVFVSKPLLQKGAQLVHLTSLVVNEVGGWPLSMQHMRQSKKENWESK